ncbi:MAG: hypothetical protein DRQ58_02610 [Gammaproteobacteria bacterium]|nr:MAG: hypothetical protein DRQ58_02610 [Gammaproteobacteria bacterium]
MPLLYIPNATEFFAHMDDAGYNYVVMRNFQQFAHSYPANGSKERINVILEDAAVEQVLQRYQNVPKRKGIKFNIHSISDRKETNFRNHLYFPLALGQKMLQRRVRWQDKFYIPCPEDHFYSLLYHVAYHKAEASGFDFKDPTAGKNSKYFKELQESGRTIDIQTDYTLKDAHRLLSDKGYNLDKQILNTYLQKEHEHGRKSYFFSWLYEHCPGEMNLFVIRNTAVTHDKHREIIYLLKKHYKILSLKAISWSMRRKTAKNMRGGKWRRGGKPFIAVVVFDPEPESTSNEDREVHPFVFNNKQFFKRAYREKFTQSTTAGPNENPLHSTDNEAEAIAHLPLFFNADEQAQIFEKLAKERRRLTGMDA